MSCCGVALSGKVALDNKAILAEDADKSWWERNSKGTTEVNDRFTEALADSQREAGIPEGVPSKESRRLMKAWRKAGKPSPDERKTVDGVEVAWWAGEWRAAQDVAAARAADAPAEPADASAEAPVADEPDGDVVTKVKQLGELRDSGLVTPEEFEEKKRELLERL